MIHPASAVIIIILVINLANVLIAQPCTPQFDLNQIQTGMLNFQNINDQNYLTLQKFNYNYFTQFSSTPKVAFAINNFQNYNLARPSFYIFISQINLSNIQFLLSNFQKWNYITINFIITARRDIWISNVKLNLGGQNNLYNIKISQNTPTSNFNQIASKAFINGFIFKKPNQNITQTFFSFNVQIKTISLDNLVLQVLGSSIFQIDTLWLSLILLSQKSQYISYGNQIRKQNLNNFQNYDLHSAVYNAQYKIFGITGFTLKNQFVNFISSVNTEFVATLYSTRNIPSITMGFTFLSKNNQRICSCLEKSLKYIYDDKCLDKCPSTTYTVLKSNQQYICLKCNQKWNMQINLQTNICQCMEGYLFNPQKSICVLYQPNQLFISNPTSKTNDFTSNQQNNPALNNDYTLEINNLKVTSVPYYVNNVQCRSPNTYFDGIDCHCKIGFFYNSATKLCQPIIEKIIEYQYLVPLPLKHDQQKQLPISNKSIICPQNSVYNGLGTCVCKPGFYYFNGACRTQKSCPLNSFKRLNDSICQCYQGYINFNGSCVSCPANQHWVAQLKKCSPLCVINSFFNVKQQKCTCIQNYGISSKGFCEYCVGKQTFILNNYCVSCMINQQYDRSLKRCVCSKGFYMQRNGVCTSKCANNEYYDSNRDECLCINLLGRLNGVCQICPPNYFPDPITQECGLCKRPNQIYAQGKCSCKLGFVPNQYGICVNCSELANYFLVQGRCATCPGDKIFNGKNCACPTGTISTSSKLCKRKCNYDELQDNQGNCFKCPINQIIASNSCICMSNYFRTKEGICQLICPEGTFKFKDRCAVCPKNKKFNSLINGCVCLDGYYTNSYNECQKFNFVPISCPKYTYLDSNYNCLNCPAFCETCINQSTCTICQYSFELLDGKCIKNKCGDGIIIRNQQCDDFNNLSNDGCSSMCKVQQNFRCSGSPSLCKRVTNNSLLPSLSCGNGIIQSKQQCDDNNFINGDGCSSICKTQRMYSCSGQPSICYYNLSYHICANGYVQKTQTCDDMNFINGDGCDQNCSLEPNFMCKGQPSICSKQVDNSLKVYGSIKFNINNIFIVIQTSQKINFSTESQMQAFLRMTSSSSQRPTTYCLQRQQPDLDLFDCLLIYPSGLPNRQFEVQFSYSYKNKIARLSIPINPLNFQLQKTKNLRG